MIVFQIQNTLGYQYEVQRTKSKVHFVFVTKRLFTCANVGFRKLDSIHGILTGSRDLPSILTTEFLWQLLF